MSAVKVEIAEEIPRSDQPEKEAAREGGPEAKAKRERASQERRSGSSQTGPGEGLEIEREYTKRELYKSISAIVVVVLYMIFTLLRDRDSGVVVVEPEEGDWDEG